MLVFNDYKITSNFLAFFGFLLGVLLSGILLFESTFMLFFPKND